METQPEVWDRKSQLNRLSTLLALKDAKDENKIWEYFPDTGTLSRDRYPLHVTFIKAGATFLERCAMASNRSGKTVLGAYEVTCHLTGLYPHWWEGRRFERPVSAWACGTTFPKTFEINQDKLFGPPGRWGTGLIPKKCIVRVVKDGERIKSAYIKHVSGGISLLTMKAYEQGRQAFEGNNLDCIWGDEEIPLDIYGECIVRLTSTVPGMPNGILILTYTPIKGLTEVSKLFAPQGIPVTGPLEGTNRFVVNITWDSVPHLTKEAKDEIIKSTPPNMRDARMRGVPLLGTGTIYQTFEKDIKCKRFPIPEDWPRSFGYDIGFTSGHPTAIVWVAKDPNRNKYYLYKTLKRDNILPIVVSKELKDEGAWIKGAIDPANPMVAEQLRVYGITLIPANNSVESGIIRVWQMLDTGELKVFSDLEDFFIEYRGYSRDKNSKIVKKDDDLMDALRYWVMTGITYLSAKPPEEAPPMILSPIASGVGWMGY